MGELSADPLPFEDGMYTTDASACDYDNQDGLLNAYGDFVGAIVRNI